MALRSTKQRLADVRLSVRRGPTVGQDVQSHDPMMGPPPAMRRAMGGRAPRARAKAPSFGRPSGRY